MTKKSNKSKKSPDDCIYDKDGCKMRAAAVCVRDESESEVLLVTSFRKTNYWVVPAGKVEIGEDYGACAIREAIEESGAVGRLGRYLGSWEHQDHCIKKKTFVYVLYVDSLLDEYQERERRRRQWFSLDEAFTALNSYKAQQSEYLLALLNSAAGKSTPTSAAGQPTSCGTKATAGNGDAGKLLNEKCLSPPPPKVVVPSGGVIRNGQSPEILVTPKTKADVT